MELLRSLATLAEPPAAETVRLAELLDLGPPPDPADHSDLFLMQMYPFASVYLDTSGQLGGEARDRILGFWRALAIETPDEADHLTVLLAYYARLKELSTTETSDNRTRWDHARQAFLKEHILSWLPFFLDKLTTVTDGFYARWSQLLTDTLLAESADLVEKDDLPLHQREATDLADPRTEGGDEFLASLVAPIRSGLILVRKDFARAGSDLGLGVRKGERRYVLKALLAQDPKATLDWLATEATLWSQRHADRIFWTGPIARFWALKAQTSADLLRDLAVDSAAI